MNNKLDNIESKMKRARELLDMLMQACFAVGIIIGSVMLLLPIIWASKSPEYRLMNGYWPYIICAALVLITVCTFGEIFIMYNVFKHKKMNKQNRHALAELELETAHEYRMAKLNKRKEVD